MEDPLLERLRRALAPEFEVHSRLGAGGMGLVFLGREVALDRAVAIKVLRPELATAAARERFLQEARLLARLQHPNIVPVHRADERDGLQYYVMDYIAGRSLADRLAEGPLQGDLTRLGHDLLRALAAAHAAGIIHRDVKPHNIFFVGERALLGDFGIARDDSQGGSGLTEEGILLGTVGYMAPEQMLGEPATERSDQYSGAAVLYQAACGRLWKVGTAPTEADWSGVARPMAFALKRALAVEPSERWPSMQVLRDAFDQRKNREAHRGVSRLGWVVLGVAGLLAGWSLLFRATPVQARYDLALLPFSTIRAADTSLGSTVAQVADVNLSGWFPQLSRVPLERAKGWLEQHPAAGKEETRRALHAEHLVSGTIVHRSGGLMLQLEQTDSGGTRVLAQLRFSDGTPDPGAIGDSVAFVIGTRLGIRPGTDTRNLASANMPANAQFLQGEALFAEDAWQEAAKRYDSAISLDPTFARARWRLLVARIWSRDFSWDDATRLAACCADQLPPLEAGLVRAMSDTNLVTRFAAFDSLHQVYGNTDPLPLLFASDLFHRGPLVRRGLPVSLDMFQKAVRSSPGGTPAPAYDQIVWGKVRLGEHLEAKRWLRERGRLATHVPGEPPIYDFLKLGYDLRWVHWRARAKVWYLSHLESEGNIRQLGNFFRFSAAWDLPEGQDQLGRLIASRLLDVDRASGLESQALARLTWGQVGEGLALLDSAALHFRSDEAELQRHQWRLMLPALGAGEAGAAEEEKARRWLAARADSGPLAPRSRWTLSVDALQRGDTASASEWIRGLERLGARDGATARLAQLASAMRLSREDPRGAIAATDSLLRFDSPAPGHDIFTRSLLHLSRARWFEALQRPGDALHEILWYENSDTYHFPTAEAQKMEVDAVASVAARLARARLLLAGGDRSLACPMLERVRQLWRRADASLADRVARADSLYREGCR